MRYAMIHLLLHTRCLLPQVMLVICQPDRQQHTGTQLLKALMKLLSHKIEPVGERGLMLLLKSHSECVL